METDETGNKKIIEPRISKKFTLKSRIITSVSVTTLFWGVAYLGERKSCNNTNLTQNPTNCATKQANLRNQWLWLPFIFGTMTIYPVVKKGIPISNLATANNWLQLYNKQHKSNYTMRSYSANEIFLNSEEYQAEIKKKQEYNDNLYAQSKKAIKLFSPTVIEVDTTTVYKGGEFKSTYNEGKAKAYWIMSNKGCAVLYTTYNNIEHALFLSDNLPYAKWDGSCKNGMIEGKGILKLFNDKDANKLSETIDGNFQNGKIEGFGVRKKMDNLFSGVVHYEFKGNFKDGLRQGSGEETYPTDAYYNKPYRKSDFWEKDVINGEAESVYFASYQIQSNVKVIFTGTYKNSIRNGTGFEKYTIKNNKLYKSGEWKDGKFWNGDSLDYFYTKNNSNTPTLQLREYKNGELVEQ
ncbi:hypothetical protein C7N43_27275 [Sphingobacteriales bacterium UPWRP_1]|nr:hypothetical protein C7N43_27275 [Sphingobacteriales bacterium UPWRP_1]